MIRIAVCDDEDQTCENLISLIKSFFEKTQRQIWLTKYNNGYKFLEDKIHFDIIFLDIDMPGMDGIETAKKLRNWDVKSKIIYVTNYDIYKNQAYKVHAFDYIEKPINESNIFPVLKDALYYLDNAAKKQKFAFKTEAGVITIELDDIYYFEYVMRKVVINTKKGKYFAAYTLRELREKFSKYNFASPHKSFIVNMFYVKYIKQFDIFMENGDVLPLAQKQAVGFKRKFNDFLQSTFDKV